MKKFTLLILVMLLGITGVNAKSRTTTLWEGTDTGADIEVAMSKLVKGATLNLTFNWLGIDGAQFSCFWWNSSTSAWVKIKNYQWVNNGDSYSFTLTDDEFDAITSDKLCFKTEAVSKMTFAKITQTETFEPTSVSDDLLTEDWASSKETAKILSAVSDARIGDVLQFTVSTTTAWTWVQFKLTDKDGNVDQFTGEGSELQGNNGNTSFTFEFVISTVADLVKIMSDGFGVIQTGENAFTLTAVKLLSYSDSHDAVEEVEMGSDGIMTYSNIYNLDFSDTGLTPYYTTSATTGKVTLIPAPDKKTWNYCGYILKGAEGTYYPKVIGKNSGTYPSGNLLQGNTGENSIVASTDGLYHYIFAKEKEGDASTIGFYKLTSAHTLAAHKAYLKTTDDITPTELARAIRLVFDGNNITNINTIEEKKAVTINDDVIYNLNGQVVTNPSKGIYIKNGKKFVIE